MVAAKQSSNQLRLHRPLRRVSIAYDGAPRVAAADHELQLKSHYQRGSDEASRQYNQQIVDFRKEVNTLREGTFSQLEGKFLKILQEAREALMTLTYDCVKRTLGGYELPPEAIESVVRAIIAESGLDEEKMEIRLHPRDMELLEEIDGSLRAQHPGLDLVADKALKRGDCVLNSRFGKIDGTMETKLERLKESLRPES